MLLTKLLDAITETIQIVGNVDKEIKDIFIDSRIVTKQSCYVAIKGYTRDGHDFIDSAIDNGATVIVYENEVTNFKNYVTYIKVANTEQALKQMVPLFFRENKAVEIVGVTGTNGKTTVTTLLNESFSILRKNTGLIGTVKYKLQDLVLPSANTTPNMLDLHKLLYKMYKRNVELCFLEVSSHGIALDRINSCDFKVAIFTNLSQDHLDFHESMEAYKEAKGKLFSSLKENDHAIINVDDAHSPYFTSITTANKFTYGIKQEADVMAEDIQLKPNGLTFNVKYKDNRYEIQSNLIGEFNVYNLLAVISTLLLYQVEMKEIQKIIAQLATVSGRMDLISLPNNAQVYVDYAHTPDALENVLQAIRKFATGKVYTVVGCGGNRDVTKRPIMAAISEKYSDYTILTSDNPRNEDPNQIINDMLKGITNKHNTEAIVDRKEAIQSALSHLNENDILLIAGKGHENYQIIGDEKIPFDDKKIVIQFMNTIAV